MGRRTPTHHVHTTRNLPTPTPTPTPIAERDERYQQSASCSRRYLNPSLIAPVFRVRLNTASNDINFDIVEFPLFHQGPRSSWSLRENRGYPIHHD